MNRKWFDDIFYSNQRRRSVPSYFSNVSPSACLKLTSTYKAIIALSVIIFWLQLLLLFFINSADTMIDIFISDLAANQMCPQILCMICHPWRWLWRARRRQQTHIQLQKPVSDKACLKYQLVRFKGQ